MAADMIPVMRERKGLRADLAEMLREPPLIAAILAVSAFYCLFILYPIWKITLLPSSEEWVRFFRESAFLTAFRNTFLSSLLSTTTVVIVAFGYAYAVNYAEVPGSAFFRAIVLLPMMSPSVITGLAFILLFGRRGVITWQILGLRTDLYGWVGIWVVQSIAFFPLAYMTMSGVLKSISPNLELAAQNLKAKGWRLFRTVTLPLALPGILSAFLLVAINSFADFGNPILVGGNYRMLATEAYKQVTGTFDMPMAAVLSLILLMPTLVVFLVQRYILEGRSFVTVTGKPVSGLKRVTVSPAAKALLFLLCASVSFVIIIMFASVFYFALTKGIGDTSFTLSNFHEVFFRSKAMFNSWFLSLVGAGFTTTLGVITAFLVSRKRFPGRRIMDFVAMLPISMPGTFMGLSLVMAFNVKPFALTGSAFIIILGFTLRQLPVGYRNAVAGFKQLDKGIEEASTNLGANAPTTFRRVVMPMLKNAVSTSFVYSFMKSMNTLSTVIFLVSPRWTLAAVSILGLADHGYYGKASATAIGMIAVIFATFGVVKLIFRDKIHIFDI